MTEIRISEDKGGVWIVHAPGFVVTDLSGEAAEAFAASC